MRSEGEVQRARFWEEGIVWTFSHIYGYLVSVGKLLLETTCCSCMECMQFLEGKRALHRYKPALLEENRPDGTVS